MERYTPAEVLRGLPRARDAPRFEPRARQPVKPGVRLRAPRGVVPALDVTYHEGRRHLPIVHLRAAA